MKPYGLRPGDGEKGKNGKNKFTRGMLVEDKPKGKHREMKLHRERCLVHRQGRQDGKAEIRKAESDI